MGIVILILTIYTIEYYFNASEGIATLVLLQE